MENNKMVKLAQVLEKIFTALFWLSIAGGILAVIFGVYILFTSQPITSSLILGPVSLTLQEGFSYRSVETISILFIPLLILPVLLSFLWTLKAIFRPIALGKPFEKVGALIRRLAWLELAGGSLFSLCTLFSQHCMFKVYAIDQLLLNDKIQAVTYNPVVNAQFVLYFAVLFLLSWVFDYGQKLQQLSDETL